MGKTVYEDRAPYQTSGWLRSNENDKELSQIVSNKSALKRRF
jgi:hypothetical protein